MNTQNTEATVGDVLFQRVYAPAFIAKAAELGITPANEQELSDLLEIAAGVRIKEAELAGDRDRSAGAVIKTAAAGMRGLLGAQAYSQQEAQVSAETVKAAQADPYVQAALEALRQ
ncbi:MAG: hypothetical protein D0530_04885 [Methylococcales bacterium]|nr:MAG: hypothetical protein D0530_04885 [Methylococcales bacterium]